MRTRTVAVLLGAAVALGVTIDLAGAGTRYEPAIVRTDHTAPACVHKPAAGGKPPAADPVTDQRLRRHCHRRKLVRPPSVTASKRLPDPSVTASKRLPDPSVAAGRKPPEPSVSAGRKLPDPSARAGRK